MLAEAASLSKLWQRQQDWWGHHGPRASLLWAGLLHSATQDLARPFSHLCPLPTQTCRLLVSASILVPLTPKHWPFPRVSPNILSLSLFFLFPPTLASGSGSLCICLSKLFLFLILCLCDFLCRRLFSLCPRPHLAHFLCLGLEISSA